MATSENNTPLSPDHYKQGGLEIIDVMRKKMSKEEFRGFCKGNVLKYITRAEYKNGLEDYKKALQYLTWLVEAESEGKEHE